MSVRRRPEGLLGPALGLLGAHATEAGLALARRSRADSRQFTCPACSWEGRFATVWAPTGRRLHAMCLRCRAVERHRLQSLVLDRLEQAHDFGRLRVLHVAPEAAIGERLRTRAEFYVSADISGVGVDLRLDLTAMTLPAASFDIVYASHVLEHIRDDGAALRNIAALLRPGGFAVLPVPIVGERTVEYPYPVASEALHVRAPGPDYFGRYEAAFDRVDLFTSADFEERYQTWVYEDRSRYPTRACPFRLPATGARHTDIVPVAYR